LAASYAALVLAHNISALLASPVLALALLVVAWPQERRWRILGIGAGGLVLGLMLSAWFWAPALAERGLVQLGQQTTGYFDFRGHFRGLDLVQGSLLHDYAIVGDADPFRMGLVQAFTAVLGLVAVALRLRRREGRGIWLAYAICAVSVTLLMTPLSRPLWERLPLLHYAQFPWRFLGLQAVLAAPLIGLLAEAASRPWQRWALAGALVALLGVGGLGALRPDRLPLNAADITPERLMLFEAFSGNVGGTVRAEYLPAQVAPRYYTSPQLLDRTLTSPPWALSGSEVRASLLERRSDRQSWQIETLADGRIVFPMVFFPGWWAAVDGQPQALVALEGAGLMALELSAGTHLVELRLGRTPARRAGELASLAAGVLLLALVGWWGLGSRRRLTLAGVGLAVLAMALGWLALRPVAPPASAPLSGPLVMDLASYPYLHHEPEGLALGDALLSGYGYDSETLTPGGELVIELNWAEVAPQQVLQVRLMTLTGHIMDQSIVWSEVNAPIDAAQMRLAMALPPDMPPGVYVLRLGVKQEGKSLPIETGRGTPQSRASLAPLWVLRSAPKASQVQPIALYGQPYEPASLALLDVTTIEAKGDQAEVWLTWRAEATPAGNYALSLRPLGADGAALAALDLAPMSPDYPTGFWRPGETVAVRVLTPEGHVAFTERDTWRIVLYDRLTLAEIGSVDVPVVFGD
jgi:hypothetical protein